MGTAEVHKNWGEERSCSRGGGGCQADALCKDKFNNEHSGWDCSSAGGVFT